MTPEEPPPTIWLLPDVDPDDPSDVVGAGADLEPGTLLAAYRAGLFPMHLHGHLAWWSPLRRGILPPDGMRISRSLRRSRSRYEIRVDTAFDQVVAECATVERPSGWITDDIRAAYGELHRLGWAHSFETWTREGDLVGGLYGVAIGGLFAGESMFHRATDASKVALVALAHHMLDRPGALIDTQWATPHLASLGVIEVSRREYLGRLTNAIAAPHTF